MLVAVVPAICQLDDLILGQTTCYSPGNSTSDTKIVTPSSTSSTSTETTTTTTTITTTKHSTSGSSTIASTSNSLPTLSNTSSVTIANTQSTKQPSTSTQTTVSIASTNRRLSQSITTSLSVLPTKPSNNGINKLLDDVKIISIIISLVLVGVIIGMITIGCYCYIMNNKHNESAPAGITMITNNVSIQYSIPSVDDNIDTEMIDHVIDAATRTDEERHCLLSDDNDN